MLNRISRLLVSLIVCLMLSGCTAVMSYDELLNAAKGINVADGIDRDEAILLAQRHVILTGLDQDVSVWHVADATFHDNDNTWHVYFRTGLDNKVGGQRGMTVDEITVAVNAKSGSSIQILKQSNP